MKVVLYVRVSTEEQVSSGLSVAAQWEKVRAYCKLHDLQPVAELVDDGLSAKDLRRPGLQEALGLLRSGKAAGLVVAKLDRLSRSLKDWSYLVESVFSEKGSRLFSVSESIDTRSASGRLMLNLLMMVAQWEREVIVERTRDAMAEKRRRGESTGEVPFGFRVGGSRERTRANGAVVSVPCLVECPREQRVLVRMRSLREQGWSFKRIAELLTADGIPTKTGKSVWAMETVRQILSREA